MGNEIRVEPLRSLNDFLFKSARFQLPSEPTWNRRVKGNLIYYQSNYFFLFIVIFLLLLFLRPIEMMTGLLVVLTLLTCFWGGGIPSTVNDFLNNRHSILAVVVLGVIYWLQLPLLRAIVVLANSVILPLLVTLLHALLRLRNINNIISNKLDKTKVKKKTPMGFLLEGLGAVLEDKE